MKTLDESTSDDTDSILTDIAAGAGVILISAAVTSALGSASVSFTAAAFDYAITSGGISLAVGCMVSLIELCQGTPSEEAAKAGISAAAESFS